MPRLLLTLFILLFGSTLAQAEPLTLVTEDYPPYGYSENGVYKGTSVDQVRILMGDAGLEYTIEMMPWARAIALARTQPMTCVFTTVHNDERGPHFKWVEPLLVDRSILVRRSGAAVNPRTLAEATQFVVGAQLGDFNENLLKARHFQKIDLTTDINLTLRKLLNGRIDLMPISEKYYEKLKREGVEVENVLLLAEQVYSLACNKSVPDADITRMQAGLDRLIANGTQRDLFHKYGLDQPAK